MILAWASPFNIPHKNDKTVDYYLIIYIYILIITYILPARL